MNRGRAKLGVRLALLAWLAALAPLCGQDLAGALATEGRATQVAVPPVSPLSPGGVRKVSAGGSGGGGMLVEVELLEAGGLPMTRMVEVQWEEVSGVSAWWLLAAAPLLMGVLARSHGRRGLRAGVRMG